MLSNFSVISKAKMNANKYFGHRVELLPSSRKDKKYMIYNGTKWIHFGQMGFEDFTKHKDQTRKQAYLTRSNNIKGEWRVDKYSPNNLARNILWH